jgi:hypothetical protein
MIVKLFCPMCAYEATKGFDGYTVLEVPLPVSRLSDDGMYETCCAKGHISKVILDNIKFELLFEIGLNAIVDGYPREAVSSFASALERFYEFYWRVVMCHLSITNDQVEATWKSLSKFSERQIGAYATSVNLLTKASPKLLNPNKEVPFRNNVIHNGYVPSEEEAISFGDVVMQLIKDDLDKLRSLAPDAIGTVYKQLSPKSLESESDDDDGVVIGSINILTAVDVRFPPKSTDKRAGVVENQFKRIIEDRQPTQLQMLSEEELKKRFPDKDLTELKKLGQKG